TALALVGCDRITGADQQKALDAEAIGYACRISLKIPEDCMKENEALSPTSILSGWKEADKDIKEKAIDPSMGKHPPLVQSQQSAPASAETEGKTAAGKAVENAAAAKSEKPAATTATGKPDKGAAEKKANH
ncbi:MAG TPA: hypothetical protein VFQ99_01830, partial [Gallionella sp.]|nr:hypothetical protein [Gallionella sp.]